VGTLGRKIHSSRPLILVPKGQTYCAAEEGDGRAVPALRIRVSYFHIYTGSFQQNTLRLEGAVKVSYSHPHARLPACPSGLRLAMLGSRNPEMERS
jgi:hypothetical protein